MKKNNRWMKWVLAESAKTDVAMPWTRVVKAERKVTRRSVALPRAKTA